MLRRNRCQLREATTLMTAAPVSNPNDDSSDDNIAASEGNEEAQKIANTNGNRGSQATGEMRSPELVRSPTES